MDRPGTPEPVGDSEVVVRSSGGPSVIKEARALVLENVAHIARGCRSGMAHSPIVYEQAIEDALDILAAEAVAASARADQAERERDLAIAHDRQPYPTAAAYEAVCKARTKWEARAAELEAALEAIARNAEAWHGPPEDSRHAAALAVIAKWARDPSTVPEGIRDHIAAARSVLARGGDTL